MYKKGLTVTARQQHHSCALPRTPRVNGGITRGGLGQKKKKNNKNTRPNPQGWWLGGWKMNEKRCFLYRLCHSSSTGFRWSGEQRESASRARPQKGADFPVPSLKKKTPDLCHATGLQLDDLGYGERENVSKELLFKSVSWFAFHSERGAGSKQGR